MDHSLDDVAATAVQAVQGLLRSVDGPAAARRAEPLGYDAQLWRQLSEAGLPGLGVSEDAGGAGANFVAVVVVAEQLGRVLAPVPFPEHATAARLLAVAAPQHPDLAAVVAGELIATVVPKTSGDVAVSAPAAAIADVLLMLDGDELISVRSEPPFASLPNLGNLPIADRELHAGARTVVSHGDAARSAYQDAHSEWLIAVAAWLNGLSWAALELVTGWVKERHQFGAPIGSFQAIQHGLADLPGRVQGSELLAREAAWSCDTGLASITGARGRELALMALHFAAETAGAVTAAAVQYHGGLGVAQEHDVQLYYRRARAYPLLAGVPHLGLRELTGLLASRHLADRRSSVGAS